MENKLHNIFQLEMPQISSNLFRKALTNFYQWKQKVQPPNSQYNFYGQLLYDCITTWLRKNTDHNNFEYGQFSRSGKGNVSHDIFLAFTDINR